MTTLAPSSVRAGSISLADFFKRYLQDKGKGRGGDGGNYRRNATHELERFAQWATGDRGRKEWTGIVPDDVDRDPTFGDLDDAHTNTCENRHSFLHQWLAKFKGVSMHHLQKSLGFLALKFNAPDDWFEKLLCYNVSG